MLAGTDYQINHLSRTIIISDFYEQHWVLSNRSARSESVVTTNGRKQTGCMLKIDRKAAAETRDRPDISLPIVSDLLK